MKHGIVIPCYNESKRLNVEVYKTFLKVTKKHEVCFVNDGSTDDTLEILDYLKRSANSNNVYIYNMTENRGKAEAVRQGCQFLFEYTDVASIGFLDADLSTSFDDYDDLCKTMESSRGRLKMVFGSRNLQKKGINRNPFRNMLSVFIRTIISLIIKLKIADTQCGAKVFSREVIPLAFKKSFVSKWLFDVEIILRLKKRLGVRKLMVAFQEQALRSWVHVSDSKLGAKDSLMIPISLFEIWSQYELKPVLQVMSHLAYSWREMLFPRTLDKQLGVHVIQEPYHNLEKAA